MPGPKTAGLEKPAQKAGPLNFTLKPARHGPYPNLRTAEVIACATGFYLVLTSILTMAWLAVTRGLSLTDCQGPLLIVLAAVPYPVIVALLPAHSLWRLWSYFAFIVLAYSGIGSMMKALSLPGRESLLLALDRSLGFDVYAFAGSGLPSLLSEILGFGYLFYFPYCIGRSYIILKKQNQMAEHFFLAMVIAYCAGFLGYILSPALGPRYAAPGTFPPTGPLLSPLAVALVNSMGSPWAVMPSMHVAATTVIFLFDLRYEKQWAVACFLPVATLWTATIGLGFHYLIDVFAGMGIAASAFWLSHKIPLSFKRDIMGRMQTL